MTIQEEISALESLAEIDASLATIEQEIQKEQEELSLKKTQLTQLEAKIERARLNIDDMERTRGELVQDARQMSLQMDRSREKLARARTEREVNAAQRETEELRKLYRDREIEIQKITAVADQARLDMDQHCQARDKILGDLGSTEGATASKLVDLEQQAALKRTNRAQFTKNVNVAVYRRYEMVRKRIGSAVTHTVDGTCAVCHIKISPMMFQKLRKGNDLDQCPSCCRIIYFRAVAAPESASPDSPPTEPRTSAASEA